MRRNAIEYRGLTAAPENLEKSELICTLPNFHHFWLQNFEQKESGNHQKAQKSKEFYLPPNGLTAAPENLEKSELICTLPNLYIA